MPKAMTCATTFSQANVTMSATANAPQPTASLQRFCKAFEAAKLTKKKNIPTITCDWGVPKTSISNTQAPIRIRPITYGTKESARKTFFPGEDFLAGDAFLFFEVDFFAMLYSRACNYKCSIYQAYATQV
jgi:hypothetical protein